MKKLLSIFLLLFFAITIVWADTPTWDIVNFDCNTDIPEEPSPVYPGIWHQHDTVGTTTNVTEDGRSCTKLYVPGTANIGDWPSGSSTDHANLQHHWFTWTSDCTVEIVLKMSDLGDAAHGGAFLNIFFKDSNDKLVSVWIAFNTAADTYPAMALVDVAAAHNKQANFDWNASAFHTLRLVVKNNVAYGYIDGYFCVGGVDCSETIWEGSYPGWFIIELRSAGYGYPQTVYLDSIKMSTTAAEPDVITPFKIQGQNIATRLIQLPSGGYWVGPSPLRYRKTGCKLTTNMTYEIPLVATTDPWASKVRIKTGSGIKALMKLPDF